MKIYKKTKFDFDDKSTFILRKMGNNFLINKSGNTTKNPLDQFLLIDKNLRIIAISNESTQPMSLSQIFTCDDGNRFLAYCADTCVLLYSDFSKNISFSINIIDISNIVYFTPVYLWLENSMLLIADDQIYELNILERKLEKIETSKVKELYNDFYIFQEECRDHKPIDQTDFVNQSYIYSENYLNFDGNYNAVFVDLKNNKIKKIEDIRNKYYDYHDIIFHKGYFIIVAEEMLTIIKDKKIYRYPMREKLYIFARVAGIDDSEKLSFIALEFYQGGKGKKDRLVRYELS